MHDSTDRDASTVEEERGVADKEDQLALSRLVSVLGSTHISPPEVKNKTLTPSQVNLGLCPRKVYYKLVGAEARTRDTLKNKMAKEVGNAIHKVIQDWVREDLKETLIEFKTRDIAMLGCIAHGRLDLILPLGANDYLAEIKSCPSKRYETYAKKPPAEHLIQMMFNAAILNYWIKPHIYILVNRDTLQCTVKLIYLDKDRWSNEVKDIETFLETYVRCGVVPPLPRGLEMTICPTCEYFHRCYTAAPTGNVPEGRVFK